MPRIPDAPRDHPDVSGLEAMMDCGGAVGAPLGNARGMIGAIAMRFVLAVLPLGLLIALSPAAEAAKAKVHHAKPRYQVVRPAPQLIDPNHPPVLMDQTPSYNDPSKFGGA